MRRIKQFILPALMLLALMTVLTVKVVYAQTGQPEPPSIDQVVQAIMSAGGTWAIAYLVNMARVKYNVIPGSIFVMLLVPAIGAGVSYCTTFLGHPGNSWFMSFLASLGSVFLSQMQAQLNGRTGAAQYQIQVKPTAVPMLFLLMFLPAVGSAQSFDYFFHARPTPHPEMLKGFSTADQKLMTVQAPAGYAWLFKPTFNVSATWIRPSVVDGVPVNAQFLSAAGPALTLQHSGFADDGSNYADYSFNAIFLFSGATDQAPSVKPAAALTFGALNNIVSVGAGYDLIGRSDGLSRWFFLISVGVNLTQN